MKLGSLFDGSGTAPLAASMCGIEPMWASEIEPYPISVTKARFPNMKHLGSILDIKGGEIEPVDIICGGSPCQDLSVAGAQKGLIEGERSNLFFEMIRIIKEMRLATNGKSPRWVIWENVPGAFSSNSGRDFLEVLRQYSALADSNVYVPEPASKSGKLTWRYAGSIVGNGWSLAWRTMDAQYWGVPQRRRRIYLVLDLGSERAGEILFKCDSLRWDPTQGGETGEGTPTDAEGSLGRSCIAFKERAGKPGGGKGILPGDGKTTFTLATSADQSVCYEKRPICLNFQGSKGNCATTEDGTSYPLMAMHGHDVHVVCTEQNSGQLYEPKSLMDENWSAKDTANSLRATESKSGHVVVEANDDKCLNPWDIQGKRILTPNCVSDALCAAEKRWLGLPPNVCYPTEAIAFTNRGYESGDKTETLRAESHQALPSACYPVGAFVGRQGAKAGSIGYQDNGTTPTLRGEMTTDVCYPNNLKTAVGIDGYNTDTTGDVSITIRAGKSDQDHVGAVEAFGHDERNTQFAKDGCCDALVASDYKQPISVAYPMVAIEGNGTRESHKGDGYAETDKMYTLNTIERHAVCYGIEGNTVDRNSQKNGSGISEDVCPTLNTQDKHAVVFQQNQRDEVREMGDKAGSLTAQPGMKNQNYVCYGVDCRNAALNEEIAPTMQAKPNGGFSYNCTPSILQKPQAVACDMYNGAITGSITPNLNASSCNSAGHSGPSVLIINDPDKNEKCTKADCCQINLFDDLFKDAPGI